MKIAAFDDLYANQLSQGGTLLVASDGSNSGVSGGDISGESGDLSVVRLGSTVSLGSNLASGALLGDVLTIIQASPAVARFATPSNSGGAAFGSNATRISETVSVGFSSNTSRADHIHDGIGTVTASSSNTLQRGTLNLRAGDNVSFGLTDGDGSGSLDTLTIHSIPSGGGGGGTSISYGSNATRLSFLAAPGASTLVSRADHVHDGGPDYPGRVEGLYQHFKADAITGLADAAAVTSWRNSAPYTTGFDLVTSTGSPTYETNELNGLPVVRLGGAAYFKFQSLALAQPYYCFVIVFKMAAITQAYNGILGHGVGADYGGYFVKSNGKTAYYPISATSYDGTGNATIDTTNWNYCVVNVAGATYNTRKNGVDDKASTNFTWSYALTGHSNYYLGNQNVASRIMSGDIAEVLIYARSLTTTEVTSVETYIRGKYAL